MGFYGPTAVFGMIRHLAQKRAGDLPFLQRLGTAAVLCGEAQRDRNITLQNQSQLCFNILMTLCADYIAPPSSEVRGFDDIWLEAVNKLAATCRQWPADRFVRIISFASSVHSELEQLYYHELKGSPVFNGVRDHISRWSADDALRFAGNLHVFMLCNLAQAAQAKRIPIEIQNCARAYGLSEIEIDNWWTLSDGEMGKKTAFMNARLAIVLGPMIDPPPLGLRTIEQAVRTGDLWALMVNKVLAQANVRLHDPEWTAFVERMRTN